MARGDVKTDDSPPPARMMTSTPVHTGPAKLPVAGRVGDQRGKPFQARHVPSVNEEGVNDKRGCSYLKGGTCMTHGPGAKLRYKLIMKTVDGPDGKKIREKKRNYFYVCNVAPAGQTSMAKYLSGNKKSGGTVTDTRGKVGRAGTHTVEFSLSTINAGQDETSVEKHVVDKKEPVLDEL